MKLILVLLVLLFPWLLIFEDVRRGLAPPPRAQTKARAARAARASPPHNANEAARAIDRPRPLIAPPPAKKPGKKPLPGWWEQKSREQREERP